MDQDLMELYEARRKDYEQALNSVPEREKPGFWRQLAATAAGAFGGWNYDRGGMQWGQNLSREITEGPYQRKYNDYMQTLEAKRKGLDLAQDGVTNKLRLEEMRDRRNQMKEATDERRRTQEDQNNNAFRLRVEKESKGAAQEVASEEEAQTRFGDQIKAGLMKVTKSTSTTPGRAPMVFVTPTDKYWEQREKEEVESLQPQFDYLAKELGGKDMPSVDVRRIPQKDRLALLQTYQKMLADRRSEANAQASTQRTMMTIAGMNNRQANDLQYKDQNTEGARSKDLWDDLDYQTIQIDRDYDKRIDAAKRDQADEAVLRELVKERELKKLALRNATHQRDAQLRGKPTTMEFELNDQLKLVPKEVDLRGNPTGRAPAGPAAPQAPVAKWVRDKDGKPVKVQ